MEDQNRTFQLQFKRYSAAEIKNIVGLDGEIMIEFLGDNEARLRIFDGEKPGGHNLSVAEIPVSRIFDDSPYSTASLNDLLNDKAPLNHTHLAEDILYNDTNLYAELERINALGLDTFLRGHESGQTLTEAVSQFTFAIGNTSTRSAYITLGPASVSQNGLNSDPITNLTLRGSVVSAQGHSISLTTAVDSARGDYFSLSSAYGMNRDSFLEYYFDDESVEISKLKAEELFVKINDEYVSVQDIGDPTPNIKQEVLTTAGNNEYPLEKEPIPGTVMLFVGGIYQSPNAYTLNNNVITIAAPAGANVAVMYHYFEED